MDDPKSNNDDAASSPPPQQLPPAVAKPMNAAEADFSFYTWTTFFNALLGRADPVAVKHYFAARDIVREEHDCKRCEESRDWMFKNSPVVRFMRSQIQELGADVNSDNVRCKRCTTAQAGGFSERYGILLCANILNSRGKVEDTMAHEMVHAYDHLRFKVDLDNMQHQACTEIRASMLSGECRFTREFFTRKQYKLTEQFQECVRRRATTSLRARPQIRDEAHAKEVVNRVWESCFSDTRPFDEIYR